MLEDGAFIRAIKVWAVVSKSCPAMLQTNMDGPVPQVDVNIIYYISRSVGNAIRNSSKIILFYFNTLNTVLIMFK